MRLFIALLLPEDIKNELTSNARSIKPHCLKGNFSSRDNYHLTLKFLGESRQEDVALLQQIISDIAAHTPQFILQLAHWGVFPKGQQNIVWRGLAKPYNKLVHIYEEIEENLARAGWPKEQRPLCPHITLARQVVFKKPFDQINIHEKLISFNAQKIALMESCYLEGKLTYLPIAVSSLPRD
ncbi:MAG: RNA 2',3'-cyclic phosphodiesterase [Bacillota bacterium]|jgi:2'-5' RNA ligase